MSNEPCNVRWCAVHGACIQLLWQAPLAHPIQSSAFKPHSSTLALEAKLDLDLTARRTSTSQRLGLRIKV